MIAQSHEDIAQVVVVAAMSKPMSAFELQSISNRLPHNEQSNLQDGNLQGSHLMDQPDTRPGLTSAKSAQGSIIAERETSPPALHTSHQPSAEQAYRSPTVESVSESLPRSIINESAEDLVRFEDVPDTENYVMSGALVNDPGPLVIGDDHVHDASQISHQSPVPDKATGVRFQAHALRGNGENIETNNVRKRQVRQRTVPNKQKIVVPISKLLRNRPQNDRDLQWWTNISSTPDREIWVAWKPVTTELELVATAHIYPDETIYDRKLCKILSIAPPVNETTYNWKVCRTRHWAPPFKSNLEPEEQPIPQPLIEDYTTRRNIATQTFDHLRYMQQLGPARQDKISITCVDQGSGDTVPWIRSCFWDPETRVGQGMSWESFVQESSKPISKRYHTRLIIVEDLSPRIINFLGYTYGISPEFFEEHLLNSGYLNTNNSGLYKDPASTTWTTCSLKKDYVSLKWYRPVLRLPKPPFSSKSEEDLLNPSPGHLSYPPRPGKMHPQVFIAETNIFRSKWDLWTDPNTLPSQKRYCAWEERASVFSKKFGKLSVGM